MHQNKLNETQIIFRDQEYIATASVVDGNFMHQKINSPQHKQKLWDYFANKQHNVLFYFYTISIPHHVANPLTEL